MPICPVCDDALELQFKSAISILACEGCKGIFVGKQAFESVLLKLESEQAEERKTFFFERLSGLEQEGPMYRACPSCKALMHRKNFQKSGIIIDVCKAHGIWFDRNEQEDIHRYILEHGDLEAAGLLLESKNPLLRSL